VGSQEKLGEIRPMDLLATSQVGLVTEVVSVYARNTENIIKAVQSGVKHPVIWKPDGTDRRRRTMAGSSAPLAPPSTGILRGRRGLWFRAATITESRALPALPDLV
jgi:hypothetical protein